MSDLQKLLLNKKEEDRMSDSSFNSEQRIEYYQTIVRELFDQIQNDWLKDLSDEKLLSFDKMNITIAEDGLGSYSIDSLIIDTPVDKIVFAPFGTLLIGTDGGIEVHCRDKNVNLVHIGSSIENQGQLVANQIGKVKLAKTDDNLVWKIINEGENHILRFVPLDKESIQKLLINLLSDE